MENFTINGNNFKNMLLVGTATLKKNSEIVNDLNVFPVPDGDTGNNMVKTMEGGVKALAKTQSDVLSQVVAEFANGALMGASGNSGVILSQILKGISIGLKDLTEVTATDLARAFTLGVETSYKAVEKPVEGTILTVFREATEYAAKNVTETSTVIDFLKLHVEQAKKTLLKTKEILPVLKQADVIDSGGAGYVYIAEGMLSALSGEEVELNIDDFSTENKSNDIDFSLFTSESQMIYGYCTEVIIRLQKSKVNVEEFSVDTLTHKLKEYNCDSIVCYKFDDAVKLHTHTFNPGVVLNECQKYGEFLQLKIENMTLEHSETQEKLPPKKVGVVAVVNGEGLKDLFTELGADVVIDGGQTLNPSSGDFLKAFDKVNAEDIFVLPNNSNVLLSAKQSAEMYDKKRINVIPVKTIQEGYVALSVINPDIEDIEMQIDDVKSAIEYVDSIEITYAVRDAKIGEKTVKKGEFMAIHGKDLLAVGDDKIAVAINSIKAICDEDDKEICTVFYGKNLNKEEIERFESIMEEELIDLSLNAIDGGQDVYDFLISLE